MRVAYSTEARTLDIPFLFQISEDLSGKASRWFAGQIFSGWQALLPIEHCSAGPDIALTGLEDSPAKSAESTWREAVSHKARTPLGQKLWGIRTRIVASGVPLLSLEEIQSEIAARRGNKE